MTETTEEHPQSPSRNALRQGVDKSGFRYFAEGDIGQAHAMAHELLDDGRELDGYVQLGEWLRLFEASGAPIDRASSEWIHLQWHMAVFEIAAGQLIAAYERYRRAILPFVPAGKALTDAPSLLWRLHVAPEAAATGEPWTSEWQCVCDAALERMDLECNAYIAVHHLLAFAGARDVRSLDTWLDAFYARAPCCQKSRFLLQIGWGLRTFANRDYLPATRLLENPSQEVAQFGGSAAQNGIFKQIQQQAALYCANAA